MSINKYYNIAKTQLFPITRSLTGKGVRKTLNIIQNEFPRFKIKKIRSGTKVFDWNVTEEWNVTDAYVVDKYNNNLVNVSRSVIYASNEKDWKRAASEKAKTFNLSLGSGVEK